MVTCPPFSASETASGHGGSAIKAVGISTKRPILPPFALSSSNSSAPSSSSSPIPALRFAA
eukprot:157030-Rhodomonas_salina.1